MNTQMTSHHVAVAAEAFAAGFFAQLGCEVLAQYGANQPEYALIVSRAGATQKISVKGSQRGGWGLIQNYKRGRTYHEAAEAWGVAQRPDIVFCLVQFEGVQIGSCPRLYLANAEEIVEQHKLSRGGLGSTVLSENYTYSRGAQKGLKNLLPAYWAFTPERLSNFLLV